MARRSAAKAAIRRAGRVPEREELARRHARGALGIGANRGDIGLLEPDNVRVIRCDGAVQHIEDTCLSANRRQEASNRVDPRSIVMRLRNCQNHNFISGLWRVARLALLRRRMLFPKHGNDRTGPDDSLIAAARDRQRNEDHPDGVGFRLG